jgi:VWFA-related protein
MGSLPLSMHAQFRASTEIVPVYATVRSADGHLVADLKSTDFEILDRGDRVPLGVFSNEPQPITVAVVVDMSGGMFDAQKYAVLHEALLAFVYQLGPNDRARIGTFVGDEIGLGYHLTSDHVELIRVVNEEVFPWGGKRPLWNAVGEAIRSMSTERGRRIVLVIADLQSRESAVRAALKDRSIGLNGPSRIWDAVDGIVSALENESGRRIIILLTDGYASGNRLSLGDVVHHAKSAGVAVYVIGSGPWVLPEAQRMAGPTPRTALEKLTAETGGTLFTDSVGDTFRTRHPAHLFESILARMDSDRAR